MERMNLKGVRTLLVDGDPFAIGLLTQMLHGLGCDQVVTAASAAEARQQLENGEWELCICEADLPDMPGADLVRWMRRLPVPRRFVPILALTGYSNSHTVTALRDAGAHLVMKKPPSAQALYDRIAWVSKSPRDFIETENYAGPDRRFKFIGPPGGVGRRASDLPAELGDAMEPNMSQDEIDNLMRPTRVVAP